MSTNFTNLASRTQSDYRKQIAKIEAKFSDFPVTALEANGAKKVFLDWRDDLAEASARQADYAFSVLALILAWALDIGEVAANPCKKPKKWYKSGRVDFIWSEEDERSFLSVASPHIELPFKMAMWTGQRQGDLIKLPWSAYDGQYIRLKQSRTGARVIIPVAQPLQELLNRTPRKAVTILTTTGNKSWTSDGFCSSRYKVCIAAGIEGLTFHDLRGTAVTRLAEAGCTVPKIAAITGHSLKQVETILDAHYLGRTKKLADSAMEKREAYEARTKKPN